MASARFLDPSSIPLRQQSGGNIWATLAQITQAITFVILLSGLTLFFFPVIHKTHDLQALKEKYERAISSAQDEQQQLETETEHMKNDQAYVEHIARDRLVMGRPGETVLRFGRYQPEVIAPKPPPSEPDVDSTP